MPSLRERLADHGFESNQDYEYIVRCLLGYQARRLRCLNIVGEPGRRKTAFANALAGALEYPQRIYHDCSQRQDPPPAVILPDTADEKGAKEAPVPAFDRAISDACALSEAEPTILILDQLQAAEFREHIRLYRFVTQAEWATGDARFFANPRKLLIFLISEEPIYHSLQKHSFRVWVSGSSLGEGGYSPGDFGLEPQAAPMLSALEAIFELIGVRPTPSEYGRILQDIHARVRTGEELAYSIFGWTEGIDQELLRSKTVRERIEAAMPAIEEYLGVDQVTLVDLNFSDADESL